MQIELNIEKMFFAIISTILLVLFFIMFFSVYFLRDISGKIDNVDENIVKAADKVVKCRTEVANATKTVLFERQNFLKAIDDKHIIAASLIERYGIDHIQWKNNRRFKRGWILVRINSVEKREEYQRGDVLELTREKRVYEKQSGARAIGSAIKGDRVKILDLAIIESENDLRIIWLEVEEPDIKDLYFESSE